MAKAQSGTLYNWRTWLIAGLLLLFSWLASGYYIYQGNQALQIPLVEKLRDPGLFPGDAFADTLKYYSAPIWWGVAWAVGYVPLEPLLFILFLLEKAVLLYAAAALAGAFFPKAKLAPLCGALVAAVGIPAILGSEGKVTANYFEQTAASVPFFLLAFAYLIKGKPWAWAISSAIGNTLNPMYGIFTLAYSGVGFGFLHFPKWRNWLLPLLGWGLLSLPAFIFAAASSQAEAPDKALWLAAASARFANHLVPLSWGIVQYVAFALLLAVVWWAAHHRGKDESTGKGFIIAAAICSLGWVALAFVARYLLVFPRLLILHPARATDLWYGISAIFLAAYFAGEVEYGPAGKRWTNLISLFISLFLFRSLELSVSLFFYGAIGLFLLSLLPLLENRKLKGLRYLPAVLILVVGLFIGGWQLWLHRATGHFGAYVYGAGAGEIEVAGWARENSPRSSLFAVPINMAMFRALSERGVVGTWKDGSAILWHRPYVTEWVKRMQALGRPAGPESADLGPIAPGLYPKAWHDKDLTELAEQFGANYCILPKAQKTNLPVVFQGREGFKIVRVTR